MHPTKISRYTVTRLYINTYVKLNIQDLSAMHERSPLREMWGREGLAGVLRMRGR